MIRLSAERRSAHQLAFALLSGEDMPSGLGLSGAVLLPAKVDTDGETVFSGMTRITRDGRGLTRATEPEPGLLDAFVALDGPEAVVAFVRRFGALGLCREHEAPFLHHPAAVGLQTVDETAGRDPIQRIMGRCVPRYVPRGDDLTWIGEPVAGWLRLVGEVRALFSLATSMRHHPAEVPLVDVATFAHGVLPDRPLRSALKEVLWAAPEAKEAVSHMNAELTLGRWGVDRWTALGDVRPRLRGREEADYRLEVSGTGTGGVLALDVILRVSRILSGKFVPVVVAKEVCAGCGKDFTPKSWARRGTRRYCTAQECQRARHRDAQRDYERRCRGEVGG